jgi:hypothetical protein
MARKTQSLDKAQYPEQQGDSTNDAKKPPEDLIAKSKIVTTEVQPHAQEEQHRAAERSYWRRELHIMGWLNWITAIAVVGGIVSLIYIKQTLDATSIAANAARIQAEVAMRQVELSERPWITADATLSQPLNSRGGWVKLDVSLKNVGRSVAWDVRIRVKIVLYHWSKAIKLDWDPNEIEHDGAELCEDLRRSRLVEGGGLVLFPDQQGSIQSQTGLGGNEVKERAFTNPPDTNIYIDPIVVGCVAYQPTFSSTSRVTGFMFHISSTRHPEGYVPVDDIIPLQELRLTPYRYATAYID